MDVKPFGKQGDRSALLKGTYSSENINPSLDFLINVSHFSNMQVNLSIKYHLKAEEVMRNSTSRKTKDAGQNSANEIGQMRAHSARKLTKICKIYKY